MAVQRRPSAGFVRVLVFVLVLLVLAAAPVDLLAFGLYEHHPDPRLDGRAGERDTPLSHHCDFWMNPGEIPTSTTVAVPVVPAATLASGQNVTATHVPFVPVIPPRA